MSQMTIDEAREQLVEATAKYNELESALKESIAGESTPERVLRHVELQGALHDAAQHLIESKNKFEDISAETAARRRERAQADLIEVEGELVEAVAIAETQVGILSESVARVLDLSKRRYAHRQEATGRAPRSLLARNATVGWLAWRLQDLELPGLDHPPHHYRARLAELLGLTNTTDQETS